MKHLLILAAALTFHTAASLAQEVAHTIVYETSEPGTLTNVVPVTSDAQFPGGHHALGAYIAEHLEYPAKAVSNSLEGTVMVEFSVLSDGQLTDMKVVNSPHRLLRKAAAATVSGMPNWFPAQRNGKVVSSKVILPIEFKLK